MTSPEAPDIIKYFYEEPASLETLVPDDDADARRQQSSPMTLEAFMHAPRYYRGYLSGSSLAQSTVGLTAIRRRETLLDLLMEIRSGRPLAVWMIDGKEPARDPALLVDRADEVLVAVFGSAPLDLSTVAALAAEQRRHALGFLRNVLDEGMPVLFPEAAHDGHDWSVFSPFPMLNSVRRALERIAAPDLRTFAIPHIRARSEEKFYFEQYDIALFSDFELGTL